jgi:hypothetical protein
VSNELTKKQLRNWVLPHPTLSEIFVSLFGWEPSRIQAATFVGFVVSFLNVLSYTPAEPPPRPTDVGQFNKRIPLYCVIVIRVSLPPRYPDDCNLV